MVTQPKRWAMPAAWAILGMAVVAISLLMADFRLDDSFLSYRTACNIAQGAGFVYNAGQPTLSITNPFYTLLLALLSLFIPNLPLLGWALSVVSITLGALLLARLARTSGEAASLGAASFYVGFPLLWLTLGLETGLLLALGILAVWLYEREELVWSAVVLAVGTITRPDMPVLAAILAADYLLRERRVPLRPIAVYLGVLLPWVVFSFLTFNSPLPASLGAKSAQAALGITGFGLGTTFVGGLGLIFHALIAQSWLWVPVIAVALAGVQRLRQARWARLLLAWGAAHLIGYVALGVVPYRWYYAPLVPGLAASFGLGIEWLAQRLPEHRRWLASTLSLAVLASASARSFSLIDLTIRRGEPFIAEEHSSAMFPLLPTVDWDIYRESGEWLRDNTPPDAVIGVAEVGQLGYYAERTMIDYLGLLQPEVAQAVRRRDIFWWLPRFTPDYLVLSEADGGPSLYSYSLEDIDWFQASYSEVARFADSRYLRSPLVIYQRVLAPTELSPVEIAPASFPIASEPDTLTLTGMAADFSLSHLEPGQPVRVRLEWRLAHPAAGSQHLVVRLLSPDGVLAGQRDRQFDLSGWPVNHPLTTYHTFILGPDLPPGVYEIAVGVGSEPESLTWQPLARARVPLDLTQPDDLSGEHVVLGEEIALNGYRLTVGPDRVSLLLAWEAVAHPGVDYTVFVHLRDSAGQNVAQVDAEPYGGLYPTGIWEPGEPVPDTYQLDISSVPPGEYELYAGLYTINGGRLLTADGADSVHLGTLSLED
jgi:arabinofuranosyltransferase